MFRYSTIADASAALPTSNAMELLAKIKSAPAWDTLCVISETSDFPRANVSWHEGHGYVVQCFEDEMSLGYFLSGKKPLTAPQVDIVLGGQAQERWPRELFVSTALAADAMDVFLESGTQKPTLHWVRGDRFPRETVWEGRSAREAWQAQESKGSESDV
jgi:hypothetical protein